MVPSENPSTNTPALSPEREQADGWQHEEHCDPRVSGGCTCGEPEAPHPAPCRYPSSPDCTCGGAR